MAAKTNMSIALDRESVETCYQYTVAAFGTVEAQKTLVMTDLKWLNDEENLSGSDVKEFQEAIHSVEEIMLSIQKKFEVLRNSISKLQDRYGGAHSSNKVNMEKASDALATLTQRIKQTKGA